MKQDRRTVMMDLRVMCNHLSKNMTVITVTLEKNVEKSPDYDKRWSDFHHVRLSMQQVDQMLCNTNKLGDESSAEVSKSQSSEQLLTFRSS